MYSTSPTLNKILISFPPLLHLWLARVNQVIWNVTEKTPIWNLYAKFWSQCIFISPIVACLEPFPWEVACSLPLQIRRHPGLKRIRLVKRLLFVAIYTRLITENFIHFWRISVFTLPTMCFKTILRQDSISKSLRLCVRWACFVVRIFLGPNGWYIPVISDNRGGENRIVSSLEACDFTKCGSRASWQL